MHSTPLPASRANARPDARIRRAAAGSLIALATWGCTSRAQASRALASGAAPLPATAAPATTSGARLLERATQLVLVTTPGWDSTSGMLRRFARDDAHGEWRPVGAPVAVVVGRSGLGWDADAATRAPAAPGDPRKREGDGRSPAGIFPL